ncbi:nicotinic acid mononucleotide adenylyltransferase [Cohnella kolymensis]|uniref:Probable nicotinate-nucleotide adenylyltransferase n=1 Tax=Cohnella kolymensis TaxID=1590652 RepID=A0ABR5A841_9BACL|nr:nicotinate-nucleotide adenylyltransferase [Cohnella kolymensis]KIL37194.1 nicotinic acid mononucleotide adenylyltransferase [Cohnella kolymensis]
MQRIGLLGGTFNPIHIGHLLAAEAAREAAELDQIWFVPTLVPPHKAEPGVAASIRLEMLQAAIAGNPCFKVEDIELHRSGTSYTIDTVTALQQRHPDIMFFWIVGSDMINDLPNWRSIDELTARIFFVGLERPNEPVTEAELPDFIQDRLLRASMPPIGISSTDIRRRLKEGKSVRYMVPDPVLTLIQRDGLYES